MVIKLFSLIPTVSAVSPLHHVSCFFHSLPLFLCVCVSQLGCGIPDHSPPSLPAHLCLIYSSAHLLHLNPGPAQCSSSEWSMHQCGADADSLCSCVVFWPWLIMCLLALHVLCLFCHSLLLVYLLCYLLCFNQLLFFLSLLYPSYQNPIRSCLPCSIQV